MNAAPTPKTIAGVSTGTIISFVLYELNTRLGITLSGEEAAFLTTILSAIVVYFTPRSAPTEKQIAEIPAEQIAAVHPNLEVKP